MAALLYPLPKERYDRIRLNPYSPLYDRLAFAFIPTVHDANISCVRDYSPDGIYGKLVSSGYIVWDYLDGYFGIRKTSATTNNRFEFVPTSHYRQIKETVSLLFHFQSPSGGTPPVVISSHYNYELDVRLGYQSIYIYYGNGSSYAYTNFSYKVSPNGLNGIAVGQIITGPAVRRTHRAFINGVFLSQADASATVDVATSTNPIYLFERIGPTAPWIGFLATCCLWNRMMTDAECAAISDLSNFDLRVPNGPPLILPERALWPSVAIAELPSGEISGAASVEWHADADIEGTGRLDGHAGIAFDAQATLTVVCEIQAYALIFCDAEATLRGTGDIVGSASLAVTSVAQWSAIADIAGIVACAISCNGTIQDAGGLVIAKVQCGHVATAGAIASVIAVATMNVGCVARPGSVVECVATTGAVTGSVVRPGMNVGSVK